MNLVRQFLEVHSYVKFKKQKQMNKEKKKRDKQKSRLLNTRNKLVVARGAVGARGMRETGDGD